MSQTSDGATRYTVTITRDEHLGSRHDMVVRLALRNERERRRARWGWIGDPEATAQFRQRMLDAVAYQPAPVPLEPRLLDEQGDAHVVRRRYRVRINPDDETEAVLLLPRTASVQRPAPGLLALHSSGGVFLWGKDRVYHASDAPQPLRAMQQRTYAGGEPAAEFFARHGFAVLALDQIGFGSRAIWQTEDEPYRRGELPLDEESELRIRLRMRYEQTWLHRALLASGVSESQISLHDNRRALDWLETMPEVDSQRLGAFGHSIGAYQCHELAALDPRVRASVRVCWAGDFTRMLHRNGPRVLGVHFLMPTLHVHAHVPELVALAQGAVLILNARGDVMYDMKAQEKIRRQVERIARRQGRIDRVQWHYFDGPHRFPTAQQADALAFFQRHLGA